MDSLRELLGIRRMARDPNAWIRELCRVKKGLDERIDEGILQCFSHVERMEKERIAKRVYVRECTGSHSVGRPWKRWIDIVKECSRKKGLDVSQARRLVQDRNEWWGVCEGECMGCSPGDKPLTLTRCHSYMKPMKGGSPSAAEPTT